MLGIPYFECLDWWDDDLFAMEFKHWHEFWEEVKASVYYELFKQFRDANGSFRLAGREFKVFFPEFWPRGGSIQDIAADLRWATVSLVGRRLVTTNTGCLGLAVEAAEKGDVVAIILGCHFPVLLPTHGEHYRVMGECYIHGLMDGEAMNSADAAYQEEEFVLRYLFHAFSTVAFGWHYLDSVLGDHSLRFSFRLTEVAGRIISELPHIVLRGYRRTALGQ